MSLPSQITQIVLQERPKAAIQPNTFKTIKVPKSKFAVKPGQALVEVDYVSLDPAMRGWLRDQRSYVPPVQIGEVMRAIAIGRVLKVGEGVTNVKEGDFVSCVPGWTEYAVMDASQLEVLNPPAGAEVMDYLGVLGAIGMTAYWGLFDIGQIKAGETLVVSGAAGATGSVVCQLGKLVGAKVIAIAGSDDKCQWLEKELGVDKAINYKSKTFVNDFKEHVGYLDVYFDNVGGEILDLCLTRLKKYARVVLCGAISAYNEEKPRGLQAYLNLISQSAKIQGFIVFNYENRYNEARAEIAKWLAEGKLKRKFHIEEGLEKAPEHLQALFNGKNTGKMVVRVSKKASAKL